MVTKKLLLILNLFKLINFSQLFVANEELKLNKRKNEDYVKWEGLVTDELVASQEKEAREDTKFILNSNSEKYSKLEHYLIISS